MFFFKKPEVEVVKEFRLKRPLPALSTDDLFTVIHSLSAHWGDAGDFVVGDTVPESRYDRLPAHLKGVFDGHPIR